MRLRRHRLPDPGRLANAGSFFKNVVVAGHESARLLERFPDLPHWPLPDGRVKLSSAWMIEQLGWKGRSRGPVGVYAHHALVLVNHGGATGRDLMALVRAIETDVEAHFGVTLEPEPGLVGDAA
jgi:UDP-N-acetylmuramate dehydrogenase